MKIAEVSVKRPVFAIMMTAALIVLGVVLVRVARPRSDAEDRRRRSVTVQANLPGASAEEIETQITKRDRGGGQHDQRHRRAARLLRPGQRAACTITFTLERDIEVGDAGRPRQAGARSSSSSRATPGRRSDHARSIPTRSRSSASSCLGPRRRRSSPRSPTSRSSRCSRRSRTSARSATTASASARSSCCSNADRLNAYGLTVDQVAHRGASGRTSRSPAAVHRRPGRGRAAHDGPHPERRGLQPHRHRLPRDGSVITFADVGRVQDSVQEVRSATRLDGTPAIGAADPQAVGHQHRRGGRSRPGRGCSASRRQLPPDIQISDRQRPVALHPPLVRGHQAAPDPRRPARQRRRLPVHPQPARHLHRRARDPDLDHRHLHVHEDAPASP